MSWQSRSRKRYAGAFVGGMLILLFCGLAYGLYIFPKEGQVEKLKKQISALEAAAKRAEAEDLARHVKEVEAQKQGGRAVMARADKILTANAPLGIKPLQLRVIEQIAEVAKKSDLKEFTYRNAIGKWTRVTDVTRQKEAGAPYGENIYQNLFEVNILADYKGLIRFLDRLSNLNQVVIPSKLHLSQQSGRMIRGKMTLSSYVRTKQ